MNIETIKLLVYVPIMIIAFIASPIFSMQKVKVAVVNCRDLATGKEVKCKVKYRGTLWGSNKERLMEHAKARLIAGGVIPSRMHLQG